MVARFEVKTEKGDFQYIGRYVSKRGTIYFNVTDRKVDSYGHESISGYTWTTRTSTMNHYFVTDIEVEDDSEVIRFSTNSGAEVEFRAKDKGRMSL